MLDNVFDTSSLLADERARIATEAAGIPAGRGTVYLAAQGGERMAQGARSMFGIEEPVVTKINDLKSILQKYESGINTAEQALSAASELRMGGYLDYAAKMETFAVSLANAETNRINAEKTTATKPDYNLQARNYYALQTNKDTWTGSLDQQRELLQEMGGMGFLGTSPYNALAKNIEEEDDKIVAKEASIESGALAISKRYADRDIITTESALSNVERLIATYDADPSREGDIPGVNWLERNVEVLFKDMPEWTNNIAKALAGINIKGEGQAAQEFIQAIAVVKNMLLKKRSGAAVTESEYKRFLEELKGGVYSGDSGMRNFIKQLRRVVDEDKANILAGYSRESQNRYMKRAKIYPTLTACKVMNSKECKAAFNKLPPGSIYFVPGNEKRYQKPVGEET
jgi:hypothetical protein